MSSTTLIVLIISCIFATSSALQCYNCLGQSKDCEAGPLIECPNEAEFCRLEWTAETGYTSQTCALSTECPPNSAMAKRDIVSVGDMGEPIVSDINNCCNYHGCNCIGSQCSSRGSTLVHGGFNVLVLAVALLFFRL